MKPRAERERATGHRGPQPADPDNPESWTLQHHEVGPYSYWARKGNKVAAERLALHNRIQAELDSDTQDVDDYPTGPDTAA